jgi:YfiH family protein
LTVALVEADWPVPGNIYAGTTLRGGGVSRNEYAALNLGAHVADDPAAVIENRKRFGNHCALPAEPKWLNQTHQCNVAVGTPSQPDPGTDALVATVADTVCAVLTADCLPVVFAAADGAEIAVAHAGWRGLCDGILEVTVAAMQTRPGEILAWLGPAIAQPAFEVGAEVAEDFIARDPAAAAHFAENERGRFQADLYGLARQRLAAAGVSRTYGGNRCTYAEADNFFSYRRDGQCGRMATFIYRSDMA